MSGGGPLNSLTTIVRSVTWSRLGTKTQNRSMIQAWLAVKLAITGLMLGHR